jgi:phosphoribosylaminoimidazole-succinocarboxamide synthase
VYGSEGFRCQRGIIIADTRFEFASDEETDEVVLVDEVLTPDSSWFWPADKYEVNQEQENYDKQYLRNWLTKEDSDGETRRENAGRSGDGDGEDISGSL